jgi:hypothetical protein
MNLVKYDFRSRVNEKFYFDKIKEVKNAYRTNDKESSDRIVLEKLLREYISFDDKLNESIDKACKELSIDRSKLLIPVIERYIEKTLKNYGIVKEKHKKTVRAEEELISCLNDMVTYYESLSLTKRKFISASMVQKFITINYHKYKQKHINVIKRVLLSQTVDFVREYHEKNNLTIKSNKRIASE